MLQSTNQFFRNPHGVTSKGPHHSHGRCFVFVRPARLPMQSHRPDILWNPPRYNMLVYKAPWLFDYR